MLVFKTKSFNKSKRIIDIIEELYITTGYSVYSEQPFKDKVINKTMLKTDSNV